MLEIINNTYGHLGMMSSDSYAWLPVMMFIIFLYIASRLIIRAVFRKKLYLCSVSIDLKKAEAVRKARNWVAARIKKHIVEQEEKQRQRSKEKNDEENDIYY